MSKLRELDLPLEDRTIGRLLARRASDHGGRTYLLFEDKRYSYAEVDRTTTRLGNGLKGLGVGKGDHVAFMMNNCPEVLWLCFGLGKVGAVTVPVNTAAKGELLAYYLNQSDSVVVVIEAALVERYLDVQDRCSRVKHVVLLDEGRSVPADLVARFNVPVSDFRSIERADDTPIETDVHFSDLAYLLYTSGTTGPSKGNLSNHSHAITIGLQMAEWFGYLPSDVLYTCLPLFHGNALLNTCVPALVAGCSAALSRRFSARAFWSEIRQHGATQFNSLGAMSNILWSQPERPDDRDNPVRQCMMVPTPDFFHGFEARFGLKLTSVYALSDFGIGALLGPDHASGKWRSAGAVPNELSVAILDDTDVALPPGQTGEICLRRNQPWIHANGYYNMPEATVAANRNQWFHTGDRGYLDDDGFLYFVDRKKDAIRRRGENISSYEVEQIILRHPGVADVAAFPVTSEMSEDEVMVAVVCRQGESLSPADLVRFCQDNMAYYMVPRFVEIAEALPKTMTEKVEKYKLRQSAEARLAEIWDREKAGIKVTR
jgi:crotonobetaine/carnitine-CoA ligase